MYNLLYIGKNENCTGVIVNNDSIINRQNLEHAEDDINNQVS